MQENKSENSLELKEKQRDYFRKWVEKNKEKTREYQRKYYLEHKEEIQARKQKWRYRISQEK